MQKRMDDKIENAAKTHDEVTADYNALRNNLQDQVSQLERNWSLSRVLAHCTGQRRSKNKNWNRLDRQRRTTQGRMVDWKRTIKGQKASSRTC